MSASSPPEPWSVDPTLRFDQIHVLESLNAGFAGRSGRRLSEELETLSAKEPVRIIYHTVDNKDLFRAVMLAIVTEAQAGHFPLIHIEAHGAHRDPGRAGTSRGIELASRSSVATSRPDIEKPISYCASRTSRGQKPPKVKQQQLRPALVVAPITRSSLCP